MADLANDKYRATLRSVFIDGVDTSLAVTAIPTNLPTIVTLGWNTATQAVFRVTGTSGTTAANYTLTGVTKIKGYTGNQAEGTAVNCLNHEEFFNQYSDEINDIQEVADDAAADAAEALAGVAPGGWVAAGETWTYTSADDPTFTFTIAGVDLTTKYYVGMRVKLTQTTAKYFIITKVAFSTDTTITVYGGTDYDLANAAITLPFYSTAKAPAGFPLTPVKWTETFRSTADATQGSPVSGTWYNLDTATLSIPIGVWRTWYSAVIQANTTTAPIIFATLSTANNSESDVDLTTLFSASHSAALNYTALKEKHLTLTSKTAYFLNAKYSGTASALSFLGSTYAPTIVKAVCAYL